MPIDTVLRNPLGDDEKNNKSSIENWRSFFPPFFISVVRYEKPVIFPRGMGRCYEAPAATLLSLLRDARRSPDMLGTGRHKTWHTSR